LSATITSLGRQVRKRRSDGRNGEAVPLRSGSAFASVRILRFRLRFPFSLLAHARGYSPKSKPGRRIQLQTGSIVSARPRASQPGGRPRRRMRSCRRCRPCACGCAASNGILLRCARRPQAARKGPVVGHTRPRAKAAVTRLAPLQGQARLAGQGVDHRLLIARAQIGQPRPARPRLAFSRSDNAGSSSDRRN